MLCCSLSFNNVVVVVVLSIEINVVSTSIEATMAFINVDSKKKKHFQRSKILFKPVTTIFFAISLTLAQKKASVFGPGSFSIEAGA